MFVPVTRAKAVTVPKKDKWANMLPDIEQQIAEKLGAGRKVAFVDGRVVWAKFAGGPSWSPSSSRSTNWGLLDGNWGPSDLQLSLFNTNPGQGEAVYPGHVSSNTHKRELVTPS